MESMCSFYVLTCSLCIVLELSNAEVKTVGNPVMPGQTLRSKKPSMWVDMGTKIPPSVAVRWRLYSSVGHRPVRLQIWRPLMDSDKFTLVAEHRVVPTSIGLHEYDLPVDSRVKLNIDDKLGFTNEMAEGPVAYSDASWRNAEKPDKTGNDSRSGSSSTGSAGAGASVGVMWAEVSMMPQVGTVYGMSHLEPERRFSISLDVVTCLQSLSIVDTHCVQFIQSVANWSQASDHCRRLGGHLVTPKSWAFASSLRRAMVLQGMSQTWLGLSYNDTTSYFTWMDDEGGQIYSMHQSAHNAPKSQQLCVALTHLGHWATVNCSHRSSFICQNNQGNPAEAITTTADPINTTISTVLPRSSTLSQIVQQYTELTTAPTSTTAKEDDCEETSPDSPYQPCLSAKYKALLAQMLEGNVSAEADITVLEAVIGSRRRHGITVLDLILLNGVLDAMLEGHNHGQNDQQTQTFVKSLADVTDTVISSSCNCSDAWKSMRKLQEGPLDTARRLEGVLHNILRHVLTSDNVTEVDVHNGGLDVHMETVTSTNLTVYRHHIEEEDVDIAIPKAFFQVAEDTKKVGISTVVFKQSERLVGLGLNKSSENMTLNSKVVSVTIYPAFNADGTTSLVIKVPHLKPIDTRYQSSICVFWDYRTLNWSTEGCRVTHFHENATVCEFNHLTNFAVLMQSFDFEIKPADRRALSIVTYVGCALSVFGLLATLLTHVVCRCFSERGRILMNLCMALMSAYILFIFGIDRTHYKRVCKLVAVGLHYFYLSAFFWMLAQGIELYSKLRIVFMQRSKIVHYSLMGWGMPALIVAVALAMRFEDYGRDEYCWLSLQTGLVWSFIGPVVIIVMINFCVLCFVLNTFSQPRLGKESGFRHPKSKSRRTAARAALILLPVLGLTWILGLLSVNEHTIMFQYLFAAANSSQGFLIFVLHCLLNEEVRASWRRHLTRKRTDSFRSDIKSVSTGFSRQSAAHKGSPPPSGLVTQHEGYPKSILRPSSSCSSSSTTCTTKQTAYPQSSIISETSVESSSFSSESWGGSSRRQRVRMLGLGYLLPGRSKSVVITDPKSVRSAVKNTKKDKSTQKPA